MENKVKEIRKSVEKLNKKQNNKSIEDDPKPEEARVISVETLKEESKKLDQIIEATNVKKLEPLE